jgi:hypothetical protein
MVKFIYTLMFLGLVFVSQAQLTHNPEPYSLVVPNCQDPANYDKQKLNISVLNDTTYTVYWKMEFTNVQDDWQIQLCDLFTCYDYNAKQSSPSNPNIMGQGNHVFEIGFFPKGDDGTGRVMLKLYGDKNFTQLIREIPINLYACTTSAKDISVSAIKVYPNPASEYFQISNSSQVNKIIIYNVLGKEIKTLFHYNNANHDISELKKGIYMVRLLDSKNKVIKTVRLSKNLDGV